MKKKILWKTLKIINMKKTKKKKNNHNNLIKRNKIRNKHLKFKEIIIFIQNLMIRFNKIRFNNFKSNNKVKWIFIQILKIKMKKLKYTHLIIKIRNKHLTFKKMIMIYIQIYGMRFNKIRFNYFKSNNKVKWNFIQI